VPARFLAFALLLATATACSSWGAPGRSANTTRGLSPSDCAAVRYTGKHVSSWGFTFTIPAGLVGLPISPACTDHGAVVPLSAQPQEPRRHIEMYAGYEVLGATSAEQSCTRYLQPHQQVSRHEDLTLDGRRGFHIVATENDGASEHTIDALCFLRATGGHRVEYVFALATPSILYAADLVTFQAVLAGVRWGKPSEGSSAGQPDDAATPDRPQTRPTRAPPASRGSSRPAASGRRAR
jgi:hypothetical protein